MTSPSESKEERSADPPPQVYITDDRTQKKARLAYLARNFKHDKLITNTWTMDCKIPFTVVFANHGSDIAEYDTTQRKQPEWQK